MTEFYFMIEKFFSTFSFFKMSIGVTISYSTLDLMYVWVNLAVFSVFASTERDPITCLHFTVVYMCVSYNSLQKKQFLQFFWSKVPSKTLGVRFFFDQAQSKNWNYVPTLGMICTSCHKGSITSTVGFSLKS